MPRITVQQRSGVDHKVVFSVDVRQNGSSTHHTVTVGKDLYERLTGGSVPYRTLVEQSFAYLLEQESNESILREFDLSDIPLFFPKYEPEIRSRLKA